MNLADGYFDIQRNPPPVKAVPAVRKQPENLPIVSAYYTAARGGILPEKEYWQLVDAYKSWVYICIDKLAKSIAMIPLKLYVYRSKQTGKLTRDVSWKAGYRALKTQEEQKYFLKTQGLEREEIFEHPFLELVNRPNAIMTRFTLWYNTVIRMELNGLCAWLKIRDKTLKLTQQIYPLPLTKYANIRPKVTASVEIEYWEYRDGDVLRKFDPADVFPIMYPHPASPFQGMSPLMAQAYPYDIDLFLMQQQRTFFEKGANPGMILWTEQELQKEQRDEIQESINERYAGALRAGETMILHSGLQPKSVGQTGREAMIDKVAKDAREKLITSFDLSPGKIGLVDDVNRANMAGLDRIFIHECLRPKCMLIEEAIETFMLPDYDRGLTCDFELPSTEDEELELKRKESRLRNKQTTVNMENAAEGREPVAWGDLPWGSFTDVQLGGAPKPQPVIPEPKAIEAKVLNSAFWTDDRKDVYWKAFVSKSERLETIFLFPMRKYFQDQLEGVLKRLDVEGKKVVGRYAGWSLHRVQQHLKHSKTNLRAINIDKKKEEEEMVALFWPVFKTILKEHGDERVDELNMVGKGEVRLEEKAGIEFNVNDPNVLKWLGSRMERFSEQVSGTTFDEIDDVLREGFSAGEPLVTISDTLRQKFDSWDQYRAPLIARTETMAAMSFADLESVSQVGLEDALLKFWLSARDTHCRETHAAADKEYADGIAIDEDFRVGGDTMQSPGNGHLAEENINCRCTLGYLELGGD